MTPYYYKMFEFLLVTIFLVLLIFFLCILIAPMSSGGEKETAYECGFHPFDTTRREFDVHFYIIALLFIIFDLELIFLITWCLFFPLVSTETFWIMFFFLFLLLAGFLVEWFEGALDW